MATELASQDIGQLLSKSLLFAALDGGARRELAGHARRQSFDIGEPIFHVGAPGQSMMVILNGTVRVSLPGPRGKGVILVDLPAGELLGEVAPLAGKERSADAPRSRDASSWCWNGVTSSPSWRSGPTFASSCSS